MVLEFLGKTGGGHALKIIKSGFLSERKVYDTPPAPLVEGPAGRRVLKATIEKAVAKCHAGRREESHFSNNGADKGHTPGTSHRGEQATERRGNFEIPLRQLTERNDRGVLLEGQ